MTQVNKDRRPIYYKNAEEMDKPLSELMEELRTEIDKTRGKSTVQLKLNKITQKQKNIYKKSKLF